MRIINLDKLNVNYDQVISSLRTNNVHYYRTNSIETHDILYRGIDINIGTAICITFGNWITGYLVCDASIEHLANIFEQTKIREQNDTRAESTNKTLF